MLSLALAHKKKCLEIQANKKSGGTEAVEVTSANIGLDLSDCSDSTTKVVFFALKKDLETLSSLESIEEKIKYKKDQLLPKYLPHVHHYILSGAHYKNPVLVRCAIWSFDIDDIPVAMELADYAIEQQQLAPEHFRRDFPTFMAEQIADWAERQFKAKLSASPAIEDIIERIESESWIVTNVIVRGKIYKNAGLLAEMNGDRKEALSYFETAQKENEKAGCKGRIKLLKESLAIT